MISFDNGLGITRPIVYYVSVLEVAKVQNLLRPQKGRDGDKLLFNSMYSLSFATAFINSGEKNKKTKQKTTTAKQSKK